jgi:integrase
VWLGTQEDGWTRARANRELEDILARIRAGVWTPPVKAEEQQRPEAQTFHEFATAYLASRKGDLRESTPGDYRWRLSCHLLPFFAEHLVTAIDVKLVDAYRAHKVAEREHVKDMIRAGTPPVDARGCRVRPLGNESINKTLALLATILDVAVDHEILRANPARGRRRRLKAVRPRRPFLEADEVQSLLQAAEQLDHDCVRPSVRALWVKHLRDERGLTHIDIENDYNIPRGSAWYLYQRATRDRPVVLVRRTTIAVLVGSGLRVSEMCGLTWRDVNLDKRRLDVKDAKTPTGVREVELSPWVVDELRGYRRHWGMSAWMPRCSRRPRAIIATATRCATRSSSALSSGRTSFGSGRAGRRFRRASRRTLCVSRTSRCCWSRGIRCRT